MSLDSKDSLYSNVTRSRHGNEFSVINCEWVEATNYFPPTPCLTFNWILFIFELKNSYVRPPAVDGEKAAWHAHCSAMTSELSLRNLQNFNFVSKTNIAKLLSTPIRICFQLESVYSCSYGESKQALTMELSFPSTNRTIKRTNERRHMWACYQSQIRFQFIVWETLA